MGIISWIVVGIIAGFIGSKMSTRPAKAWFGTSGWESSAGSSADGFSQRWVHPALLVLTSIASWSQ